MKRRTFTVCTLAMFVTIASSALMTAYGGGVAIAAEKKLLFVNTTPLSGTFAEYGKTATMGAQLAVKETGKVLGRNIELVTIDTESNPGKAARSEEGWRGVLHSGWCGRSHRFRVQQVDVSVVGSHVRRYRADGAAAGKKNAQSETLVYDHAAVCVRRRPAE